MAKKPAKAVKVKRAWDGELMRRDDLVTGLELDIRKHTGHTNLIKSADSEKVLIGIPLEAFSQRLLYQSTVLPVGRMIHIYGPTESMKSALSFDILRMHAHMRDGCGFYHLAEPRDQAVLRNSTLEYAELIDKIRVIACPTMDTWQLANTRLVQWLMKSAKKPGYCPFVICSVVDSIAGAATGKTVQQVLDDGFARPGFSEEAKSLNIFSKVFFDLVMPWPITWVGTNHQKFAPDKHGHQQGRTPGGAATGFYTSYGFAMKRIRDYKRLNDGGRQVMIRVDKNSLGDARTMMFVNLLWYHDDAGQHTYWDWHDASIRYLKTYPGIEAKEGWRKKVEEVVDLEFEAKADKVSSAKLGCKKVSFHEAGALMEQNEEVSRGLDRIFGIHSGRTFVPGVPYELQRQMAQDDAPFADILALSDSADIYEKLSPRALKHEADGLTEATDEPEEIPADETD